MQWLGVLPYRWALYLQRTRRKAVVEGRAPEVLWAVEHPAVVTRGRRGGSVLRVPSGVEVVDVERGGLATVHVPGQLVGYLIVNAAARGIAVRDVVHRMEQGLIDWLRSEGIDAERRAGHPGVWVAGSKIAALGLHFRRGVSMHGFALNLRPDLEAFDWVVPCGMNDVRTTSVAAILGVAPEPWAVANAVGSLVWHAVVDTPGVVR